MAAIRPSPVNLITVAIVIAAGRYLGEWSFWQIFVVVLLLMIADLLEKSQHSLSHIIEEMKNSR